MTHVLLLLSSFNTQYLLLFAGNRSSCYISISGTGRSFREGGRRLETQSLPGRSGTYQGEPCLVTKVSESVSVFLFDILTTISTSYCLGLAKWLLLLLSQHSIYTVICSLHLQETGAVTMPTSIGQFPSSMKKIVLEPLSEMENVSLLCRG